MRSVVLALVLAAGSAAAQPAPPRCDVTISRAPDEVRAAIEHWLAAEARCSVALDLRVVPTDGGYYVLARDDRGELRERVVPDAQSAGVLVASWAADDGIQRTPPRMSLAAFDGDGAVRPSPDAAARPPGLTADDAPVRHAPWHDDPASHWVGLDAMNVASAGEYGMGLRAELDLATRGHFALGASAAVIESHDGNIPASIPPFWIDGSFQMLDIKALVYASAHAGWHGFDVRASVGAGFVGTTVQTLAVNASVEYPMAQHYTAQGVFPTAEAALLVGHSLGHRFAFELGPIASVYNQTFQFEYMNLSGSSSVFAAGRAPVQWSFLAGLRYRL